MNKIFIIGAGEKQAPYIKLLRERGFRVMATDYNPEAPGLAEADLHRVVSTHDLEGNYEAAREFASGGGLRGVFTFTTGEPHHTAAVIAGRLRVKGFKPEDIRATLDRFEFRERLCQAGLSQLRYAVVSNPGQAKIEAGRIGYPLIIKPNRGGMGGAGVEKVDDEKTLESVLPGVQALSLDRNVYFEELLSGKEYKVSSILYQATSRFLSADRLVERAGPDGLPVGHAMGPSRFLSGKKLKQFKDMVERLAALFGIDRGPLGFDLIDHGPGRSPEILDMELVLVDSLYLAPYCFDYNLHENSILPLLDIAPEIPGPLKESAALYWFIFKGELSPEDIGKPPDALSQPGVQEISWGCPRHGVIIKNGRKYTVLGYLVVGGSTQEEAVRLVRVIGKNFINGTESIMNGKKKGRLGGGRRRLVDRGRQGMKSILFIGLQDPVAAHHLSSAREIGFTTIAANRNPDSISLKEADLPLLVDGKDIRRLLEFVLLNREKYNISGVYTATDLTLTSAVLSQALGLPGIPLEAAYAGENKTVMKNLWLEKGISTPPAVFARDIEEARKCLDKIKLPAIVKPADSVASAGITVVEREDELPDSFKEAIEHSSTGTVVIESYLNGTLHDANGFFFSGEFYRCGLADKSAGPPPFNVVAEANCPTSLSPERQAEVYDLLRDGSLALGIDHGPVKADMIMSDGKLYLLEIAPRFHGPIGSFFLIPNALGIDMLRTYMRTVFHGVVPQEELIERRNGIVLARAILPSPGRITAIEGLEEALATPGVVGHILQVRTGDDIGPYTSNYRIPGYVMASGGTRSEAEAAMAVFLEKLRIEVEPSPEVRSA
ncbi:ATP-grasp domain-containing protein [candidate division KSB1 bacterium]